MDSKNKILNQIFKILVPLRSSYKDEIDKVTNDLLIGYTKSLEDFINKYYANANYSDEMVSLIVSLVNANLIPSTYLEEVSKKVEVTNVPIYKLASSRPLNVRIITFNNIKESIKNNKSTKLPISIIADEKEVQDTKVEITNTNPNLTPIEINPINNQADITIPQENINTELPDFNKMATEIEQTPDFKIPNPNPDFEIPPIMIEKTAPITLETQEVVSKDDIFNSLQKPEEEVTNQETVNPDLKHTTQLGQLLQFPLDNQNTNPEVVNQVIVPIVEPQPVNIPTLPTQIETKEIINDNPVVTPTEEPVQQTVTPETTYQETPMVPNTTEPNEIQTQPPIVMPTEESIQQTITPEVVTYQEPITLDLPTPVETYKVAETPKEEIDNNYSKEELNEEIAAKVREEVKKQVTEQITKELAEQIRLEEKNNIVRIQNNYMNNASAFIQNLNSQSEEEIYMSLRYLNDLKYMSHCITHLNLDTLERFYRFIEDKLNSPQSEFMDGFIEKRIREKLPPNLIEQIDEGIKKVA